LLRLRLPPIRRTSRGPLAAWRAGFTAAPGCRGGQHRLGLADGELAVVEDAGRQHRVGAPTWMPSARCCSAPTPPEAITGTGTASLTARVSARSKPILVPSRSMLVSRISPAPCSAIWRAQATASSPVFLRPPWV
jgi:hypothetical protein